MNCNSFLKCLRSSKHDRAITIENKNVRIFLFMSLIIQYKAILTNNKNLRNISELMKYPNQQLSLKALVTTWKQRNNSHNVQLLKY